MTVRAILKTIIAQAIDLFLVMHLCDRKNKSMQNTNKCKHVLHICRMNNDPDGKGLNRMMNSDKCVYHVTYAYSQF